MCTTIHIYIFCLTYISVLDAISSVDITKNINLTYTHVHYCAVIDLYASHALSVGHGGLLIQSFVFVE